jgi:hypothetical protein
MTTYSCVWCGSTEEWVWANDRVACGRCVREFSGLLGFVPRTLAVPVEPGEDPGPPAAARMRFEFRDARTGDLRGRTEVVGNLRRSVRRRTDGMVGLH